MRSFFAAVLVVVGFLAAYSLRTVPATAQAPGDWVPFNSGETVKLSVDLPEGVIVCKTTQVVNGFLGCARDERLRQSDRWINLRFIKDITPAPPDGLRRQP
jgi:hypothetical protein